MKSKIILAVIILTTFLVVPTALALETEGMGPDEGQQTNTQTNSSGEDTVLSINTAINNLQHESAERKEQLAEQILTRVKNLLKKKIEVIISRYKKIKARINNMKVISDDKKVELSAKIDTEIVKLEAAKTKVDSATTVSGVKTVMEEVKEQVKNSVAIVKEIVTSIHATHLENILSRLNTILDKLTVKVNELKTQGKDVTKMEALISKVKQSFADAKTDISAKEFKSAKENILAARKSLVELSQKIKAAKGE